MALHSKGISVGIQNLVDIQSPFFQFISGDINSATFRPLPPENILLGNLCFVSTPEQFQMALDKKAGAIVALAKLSAHFPKAGNIPLFSTSSIQAAMAALNPLFDERRKYLQPSIHASAVIHPTASIGKNVFIGALCTIDADVIIADHVILEAGCTVEARAKIGERSHLHSQVVVGFECEIGNDCILHSHCTLGSDGFGFVQDPQTKTSHKISHLGKVILEDHVEIGANTAIDRATLTETRICRGTKIDNLAHIAHNVRIGKNGLLTAGFMAAGSAQIGDNLMTGGGTHVKDHANIADNVVLASRTGVVQDITEAGAYMGFPQEPMKDGLRTMTNLKYITQMRKQLSQVIKHLGLNLDKED